MPGRYILDSIVTVHENLHSLMVLKTEGFILKLDISKAYDQVDWHFLFKILVKFGFNNRVIQMVNQLVSTVNSSIIINGSPLRFFQTSQGLKQGDPISPILFTILAESLGRNIKKLVDQRSLVGLTPSSSLLTCSHQQFVDDTILMGRSTVAEAKTLKKILNLYESASGQVVNRAKSSIFFLNTPEHRQFKLAQILGCQIEPLPSTYLGLPLCSKPLESFWISLVEKFNKKLSGWKGALLSQAGKIQLLKASLQNLPVYALSIFKILVEYAKAIEKF